MTARRDALDMVEWAKERGWAYEGIDGRGHHTVRWSNGRAAHFPATPSDHRSLKNTRSMLARIDGQPVERIKRGSVRHVRQSGYTQTRAVDDPHADRRASLLARLSDCARDMATCDPRGEQAQALHLAKESIALMRELRTCGYVNACDIPPAFHAAWHEVTRQEHS